MTAILGISAFYHDSAAAIVVDGTVVAAAQEERFSRIKHDSTFPIQAIEFCLSQSGLTVEDLDHVVFYEKPFLKFERILETYLSHAPRGYRSFLTSIPIWLRSKLYISRLIQKGLGGKYRKRIIFPEHHQSHAASAFFCSPFEDAAILTVDGVGEWATTTFGVGDKNHIELNQQICFPDSLGLLYSAFTYFCGFRVNGGEGKLMGLAPYGKPIFTNVILEKLIDVKSDGSFRLSQEYFNYAAGDRMTSAKFAELFGGPARIPESEITSREKNLAASIQEVTETILLKIAAHMHQQTGKQNLCIAGGVGLNCVANGRLLRESPFENVWVQPAAGDSGGAIGAALFAWHHLLDRPRNLNSFATPYLGSIFSDQESSAVLGELNAKYEMFETADSDVKDSGLSKELCHRVAQEIASGKVVGWFQGAMEFGPRALGNRSILADPRNPEMQDILNSKVKFREPFRPFAPVVLAGKANEFFELETESPYMLIAAQVLGHDSKTGSPIAAVTHVDGSARIQTVTQATNPALNALLTAFESETGCPVLVNTSFNIRGEPIVCTVEDAYRCFMKTEMDVLVIGNCLLLKDEQPPFEEKRKPSVPVSIWKKLLGAWMVLTFPIRFVVSKLALTLVFLLLILPLGLVWRKTNRNSFQPIDSSVDSYWQSRTENKNKSSYFKQY